MLTKGEELGCGTGEAAEAGEAKLAEFSIGADARSVGAGADGKDREGTASYQNLHD